MRASENAKTWVAKRVTTATVLFFLHRPRTSSHAQRRSLPLIIQTLKFTTPLETDLYTFGALYDWTRAYSHTGVWFIVSPTVLRQIPSLPPQPNSIFSCAYVRVSLRLCARDDIQFLSLLTPSLTIDQLPSPLVPSSAIRYRISRCGWSVNHIFCTPPVNSTNEISPSKAKTLFTSHYVLHYA